MTVNNHSADPSALPDEELVAYLDGELDAEAGRRIEALLATDPKLRRRLQSLERTWDLLDELDTVPVGEPFIHTTLEMVTVAGREEVEREKSAAPRRRRRWRLTVAGLLIAAAAAGFAAAALFVPDPNRQLLENLPLLEHFDEYRHGESVAFLRLLRDKGLFLDKDAAASGESPEKADPPLAERRETVEKMDPDEEEQLREVAVRFAELPPDERQLMQQLHQALLTDPDADQLRAVMRRYCDWLRTLSSYSRTDLTEMDPQKRVEWIKKRLEDERLHEGGGRLGNDDLAKLRKWSFDYAAKYEKQFLASLSDTERKRLAELNNPRTRRWMVYEMIFQRWREADDEKPLPMMNDAELKLLRGQLSPPARKRLESVPPAAQWKMAAGWLRQGMRRPGQFGGGPGAPGFDDERLARFFEEELDGEQRDRLLGMSPEDMQRELRRMFLQHTRSQQGPHRRGGGFNRDNRPPPKKP